MKILSTIWPADEDEVQSGTQEVLGPGLERSHKDSAKRQGR